MTYDELIEHYQGVTKAADALGLSKQTVGSWKDMKRVPTKYQLRVQVDSEGKLHADAEAKAEAAEYAKSIGFEERAA